MAVRQVASCYTLLTFIEWIQTDGRTDRRTEAIALPDSLIRSLIKRDYREPRISEQIDLNKIRCDRTLAATNRFKRLEKTLAVLQVRLPGQHHRDDDGPADLRVRLPGRQVLPERALLLRGPDGRHQRLSLIHI